MIEMTEQAQLQQNINIEKIKSFYAYYLPDSIQNVIFCGDIHGKFDTIVYKLCKQLCLENTALILVGDCGYGFYRYNYYKDMSQTNDKILKSCNNYVLCIRGNHDSPPYFNEFKLFHSERIFCLPDYSVIQTPAGSSILCVGGAISIDRLDRIADDAAHPVKHYNGEDCYKPKSYWKGEQAVFDKNKLDDISEYFVIDTVAAHSCPSFIGITDYNNIQHRIDADDKLLNDLKEERNIMDNILYYLLSETNQHTVSNWFYGHFHKSKNEFEHKVHFSMLDCEEFKELRY